MSYFTFENKKIYYSECGTGRPLLFLHGNTASSNMYAQIADRYNTYKDMIQKIGHGKIHLFNSGGHPAMITNQDEFYKISRDFLLR